MPNTFTLIASTTVGAGGTSTITFSSIPSTYTDLKIFASFRSNVAGEVLDAMTLNFNGNTTGYSRQRLIGTGSGTPTADSASGNTLLNFAGYGNGASATSNTFGNSEIYIPNYAGSANKTVSSDGVAENNGTLAANMIAAGLWSNTAAITSIELRSQNSATIIEHSTFYLYGIVKP